MWVHGHPAFISVNALRRYKGPAKRFQPGDWIMDSGAFTEISKFGAYRTTVAEYAEQIRKWKGRGNLIAAVSQDYMCEPFVLKKTGMTVADHQRLTIKRYDALVAENTGVYIMPVLQGFAPQEYADHVRQYGDRLAAGAYVGVGSVCKRNARPDAIAAVLDAILQVQPDLRIHGFGIKASSLRTAAVRDRLFSADSMAWSFAARMEGRDGNSWLEALAFARGIAAQQVQGCLFTNARMSALS